MNNKNKNNGIWSVFSTLAMFLVFFFAIFSIASNQQKNQNEISVNKENKSEMVAKQESNSTVNKEEQLIDFLKKYKDKYSFLVPYKLNLVDDVFYYNAKGNIILLFDKSLSEQKQNKNYFVKVLDNNQSEFNKETVNILNQFKNGDSKTKIEILSSNAGKTHLLYQYQSKNLSENLSGLFLDITIYYNPGSEYDKLAESLNLIVDYSEKSGKIYRLNFVDVNKADPLELEEIRYSGDIIAISHPVQILEGCITNHPELRSRIKLSDNPENILKLTEYYN